MEVRYQSFHLTCKAPDNVVYLQDLSIVTIDNLVKLENGEEYVVGRKFRSKSDLYMYPCASSYIDVFKIHSPCNEACAWPLNEVKCKAMKLKIPNDGEPYESFGIFPILLEDNCQ